MENAEPQRSPEGGADFSSAYPKPNWFPASHAREKLLVQLFKLKQYPIKE